jgi:hypothetical protein
MWRTGLGILLLGAAVACFMASRYAADTTNFYVLINLGCAGLVAAAATQVPGLAAFLYSYVAVLVVTLSVNGFFVLAASLLCASVLSYLSYNYFLAAPRTRSAGLP